MNRTFAIVALLLWTVHPSGAQPQARDVTTTEVNLGWALPQGAFGDNVGGGPALTTFVGGRVPGLPLVLGTELSLLHFGTDEHLALVSVVVPVSTIDVRTSNNLLAGHLVARLQPADAAVAPYLDALVGLRYFFAETRIESDFFLGRDGLFTDARFDDFGFSYGVGGGLALRFFAGALGWDERAGTVSMHLGLRYLFGSEAEYLREGSLRQEGNRLLFDTVRSRTDLLMPQLGLRVRL